MNAYAKAPAIEAFSDQPQNYSIPRRWLWTGRVLSGLVSAFFVLDGGAKLFKPVPVVQANLQLGYPESTIIGMGIVLLACTALYLISRTAFLGAILLTGYLGGAVATHVRVGAPWFNILFPVVFGCVAWAALYLRDGRLKSLLA
jgi:hypothetical protein